VKKKELQCKPDVVNNGHIKGGGGRDLPGQSENGSTQRAAQVGSRPKGHL